MSQETVAAQDISSVSHSGKDERQNRWRFCIKASDMRSEARGTGLNTNTAKFSTDRTVTVASLLAPPVGLSMMYLLQL